MNKITPAFFILCALNFLRLDAADLQCTKRLAEQFFPTKVTTKALSLYDIPQSQWTPINNELKKISPSIGKLIEQRARLQSPYPFQGKELQLEAFVVMRETLFEQFALAIRKFFNANDENLRQMFIYISMQHLASLKLCFGKEIFETQQKEKS